MKRLFCLFVLLLAVAFLSGCTTMAMAPTTALLTLGVKGPVGSGPATTASKTGTACSEGILIVAYGDASIETAMKNGRITKISTVDYESSAYLGIYSKNCTIVKGE